MFFIVGTLFNCLIAKNKIKTVDAWFSLSRGGGAYESILYNCTVTKNTAKNADGSGLDAEGGGTYHCAIYNSILYNNSPADTWASI